MALFRGANREPEQPDGTPAGNELPVLPIDFSKRYDIYCSYHAEERLYENMRIVGIRTMEKQRPYSSVIGGYIEIEDPGGKRVMIPHLHIHMICEHGLEPEYKVLRTWWRPRRPAQ
jgi:hypothetical protein